jgi:hypothetical protein
MMISDKGKEREVTDHRENRKDNTSYVGEKKKKYKLEGKTL